MAEDNEKEDPDESEESKDRSSNADSEQDEPKSPESPKEDEKTLKSPNASSEKESQSEGESREDEFHGEDAQHNEGEPVDEVPQHEEGEPVDKEPQHEEGGAADEEPQHDERGPGDKETQHEEGEPVDEEPQHEEGEPVDEEPQQDEGEPADEEPAHDDLTAISKVKEYNAEELKQEIDESEKVEDNASEQILLQIQEERKQLEKERAQLAKEKEEKTQKDLESKEKEEREKEKIRMERPKTEVKSFSNERRKRKSLERVRTYLTGGEYALLLIFVLAQLYSEGISSNPLYIPFENTFYILIIFFLIMKIQTFAFRYLNMIYSGTVQRKSIGVELFRSLEWPIIIGWAFVVAILLIPATSGFIELLIKIFTREGAVYQTSDGFILKLALLSLAHLIAGIVWIAYLTRYKNKVIGPELKAISEPFEIEEVFLITNSGLLIKRISREANPDMDDDILSSMLTAVGEFVKDSFGSKSEEGELDELQYGRMRIIIEYGRDLYLAIVVKGQETKELRPEMNRILRVIHRKYTRGFDTWDGDLARFRGSDAYLRVLFNHQ
jgi:hypothetical protein